MTHLVLRLAAAVLFGAAWLPATPATAANVAVCKPWARASVGTTRPGVAYLTLENTGAAPIVLTGVETPVATRPELHESVVEDGRAEMRRVKELRIAPGESVTLAPGGLHVMLIDLQGPLEEGRRFELTLRFDDGTSRTVTVPILSIGARGPGEDD